jgi:hypothetical protein
LTTATKASPPTAAPSLHRRRSKAVAGDPHRHLLDFVDISLSRGVLPVFYPDSIGDAEALPDLHRHIPCSRVLDHTFDAMTPSDVYALLFL